MYALGIETSCDDTGVAIVTERSGRPVVIAEAVSSQAAIHRDYGGVVPELAAREHLRNLPYLLDEVLSSAALSLDQLGVIGVTQGQGLKGCLLMGLGFAKGLALAHGLRLIGVNHIEGHLLAAFLDNPQFEFPFLALVVSGGHTEIHLVTGLGQYRLLARTLDDAAGEAFDKSAHLLGLTYPGGPELAALADKYQAGGVKCPYTLPRVMRKEEHFSFSGLKTAIAALIRRESDDLGLEAARGALACAVQTAIVDELMAKLSKAIADTGAARVVITGGVAANRALRERVKNLSGVSVFFPERNHCIDNGAMIAFVARWRSVRGELGSREIEVLSRWPVEQMQEPEAAGGERSVQPARPWCGG